MNFLGRLYSQRLINVNVNVVAAGLLAMLLTLIPVHLTRHITDDKLVIWGVTVGFDVVFDVAIYYALHWVANHKPRRRRPLVPGVTELSFLRDATLVQFERAMLAPVYYSVFSGVQLWALHTMEREWAAVFGIVAALTATRILHTIWMLRCERRAAQRRAAVLSSQAQPVAAAVPSTAAHSRSGAA